MFRKMSALPKVAAGLPPTSGHLTAAGVNRFPLHSPSPHSFQAEASFKPQDPPELGKESRRVFRNEKRPGAEGGELGHTAVGLNSPLQLLPSWTHPDENARSSPEPFRNNHRRRPPETAKTSNKERFPYFTLSGKRGKSPESKLS